MAIGNELKIIEDIEKRAKRSATYCNTMYENLSSKYFTREQKVHIIAARIQRDVLRSKHL